MSFEIIPPPVRSMEMRCEIWERSDGSQVTVYRQGVQVYARGEGFSFEGAELGYADSVVECYERLRELGYKYLGQGEQLQQAADGRWQRRLGDALPSRREGIAGDPAPLQLQQRKLG